MKKNENKVTLSRAFRVNSRAFKLLYNHYPQMVLSHLISVVWNALTPYIGIFLSALVIDELVGNRDVKRLQMLVIITLASAAVIALGTALLNKWKNTQSTGDWIKIEHIVSEKMLNTIMSILMIHIPLKCFPPSVRISTAAVGGLVE